MNIIFVNFVRSYPICIQIKIWRKFISIYILCDLWWDTWLLRRFILAVHQRALWSKIINIFLLIFKWLFFKITIQKWTFWFVVFIICFKYLTWICSNRIYIFILIQFKNLLFFAFKFFMFLFCHGVYFLRKIFLKLRIFILIIAPFSVLFFFVSW